jgi:hypothetical protein
VPSLNAPSGGAAGGARNGMPISGSALAACAAAQAQSGSLILAATGEASQGGLGRDAEELLRQHLKRRHAASILSLKEEFLRKRKKGKLPKDATSALKAWWQANLVWPYPTDDDKRALGDDTCLNATQINNCAFCVRVLVHGRAARADALPRCARRVHQPAQAPLAQGGCSVVASPRSAWNLRCPPLTRCAYCVRPQLFLDGPPTSAEEAHRVRARLRLRA